MRNLNTHINLKYSEPSRYTKFHRLISERANYKNLKSDLQSDYKLTTNDILYNWR